MQELTAKKYEEVGHSDSDYALLGGMCEESRIKEWIDKVNRHE